MKKSFKLQGLDCANCASKMERAVAKLDGVENAVINFMAEKLIIEADESRFDEILDKAAAAIKKVDRDCVIVK